MIEGLVNCDAFKITFRLSKKWSSGCSEPYGFDFIKASASHALMYSIVLAINWEQRLALTARLSGDQLAGSDQAFFISESDYLAGAHCFISGFKSCNPDDGTDHEISLRMRSNLNRSCWPVHNSYIFYAGILQPGARQRGFGLLRDRDKLRPPAAALLENCIDVIASGQRDH